jgi:hypothetical protein
VITGPPLTISERLAEDTTYYWRVRAEGSAGFSSWSSTYSFTTALVYRLREWKLLERWSFNWGYEAFPAIFGGQLSLENVEGGMSEIVIKHVYGDRATDAVERTATGWQWKNLELRVNGVVQGGIIRVISEGRDVTSGPVGVYSLVVGDLVRVRLSSPLRIGDIVSLKWVPKNQTLMEIEVAYWGYEAFPTMSFAATLESNNNVILTVMGPSGTIRDGEWEYRGMTAGGTVVGSWVAGSGELREGASVTLTALKTYVDAGQLRVGDKVQIRHKPSGHVYDVPIVQGYTVGQNDMGSGSDAGNTFSTALLIELPADGEGYLDSYDTDDYYVFYYLSYGNTIFATLYSPEGADFDLYLYDPSHVLVASSTQGTGVADEIEYSANTNGYYYLRVYRFSGSGIYSLSIWTGFGGSLLLENVENGSTTIVIKHIYGSRALDVVENTGSTFVWRNLELRVNGVIVPASNIVTFISEGVNAIGAGTGTYSMVVGDMMRVTYPAGLKIGDRVSLKWVPANQVLVEREVTY